MTKDVSPAGNIDIPPPPAQSSDSWEVTWFHLYAWLCWQSCSEIANVLLRRVKIYNLMSKSTLVIPPLSICLSPSHIKPHYWCSKSQADLYWLSFCGMQPSLHYRCHVQPAGLVIFFASVGLGLNASRCLWKGNGLSIFTLTAGHRPARAPSSCMHSAPRPSTWQRAAECAAGILCRFTSRAELFI